jgi:hypothetical protein
VTGVQTCALPISAAEIAKRLRGKPGKPGPRAKVAHIIELPAIWMLVTAEERKHPKLKIPRICKELSQRKTIAKDLLDALPFGVMQEVADELIKRFHSAYYQKHGTLIRRYNEACQKFGKDSASLPGVQAPEKEFADFIASLMGND